MPQISSQATWTAAMTSFSQGARPAEPSSCRCENKECRGNQGFAGVKEEVEDKEEEKEGEGAAKIVHLILHQNTPPKPCTSACMDLRFLQQHVRCLLACTPASNPASLL